MRINKRETGKISFPISSMIDCTFLLLIYFMSACSLNKTEGDLGFSLPGEGRDVEAVVMPDEQVIEVGEEGAVVLNGQTLVPAKSRELDELSETLLRFQAASRGAKIPALISISAADDALHERIALVLDCCHKAGLTNVTFNCSDED